MNRRTMLRESLKLSAAATLGIQLSRAKTFALKTGFLTELTGNPLRFPPAFTNGSTMTLASTDVVVWNGTTTQVTAINGSYPCPTVRVQRGSVFSAHVVNQLSEDATVHWHGLIAPAPMDGHPKDPIHPGNSFTYAFPIIQRAGTYFYHAHGHMLTAKQVYQGFAGLFIIDDDNEIPLGLPRGDFDVPLVIQDRRSAYQPQFTYSPTMMDTMTGYLGDLVLVNGTPDAYFEVSRTLYRFRLVNGSNARVYKIAFADNHPFHIIATDGGLKDQAVSATSFFLSPGERVDILMDFSSYSLGQNVLLKSLPFTEGGGTQGLDLNIIRFDITSSLSSGGVVPTSLPIITYHNPSDVVRTRTFILTMSMSGGGMHKINNRSFELNRIDEEVPGNQLEEWRIVNGTDEFHPMHIHGVLFQVYSRNGNTNLPPTDKGWKDTVLVNPSETVRVLVKFVDYNGIYLFHCHNLEHEDDGMMMNFRVNGLTSVHEGETPSGFRLHQNYPNPFNPSTKTSFEVPSTSDVELTVFNVEGRQVATLLKQTMKAGRHTVEFTATDSQGANLSSGAYFVRMIAGDFVQTLKIVLMK